MSPTPQELLALCQKHEVLRPEIIGLMVLYFRGKNAFIVKAYGDSEGSVLWAPVIKDGKELPLTRLSREQFIDKLTGDLAPVAS